MFFRMLVSPEIRLCQIHFKRAISNNSSWDIMTGVCVERLPVVTQPLDDMQKKYQKLLTTIEVEKSLKSDHEMRHESDRIQAELIKNESVDVDIDTVSKITAQDFEDAANDEFAKFKLADIITEADKKNDKTSTERCLQRHLVLVTQHKLGKDVKNLLPQGLWQEGESLRQTAERVLKEHCGPKLSVQFLSNAPCGFYKYKYPTEINGKIGAKVFFYYCNYKNGTTANESKASWLTRSELSSILPEKYSKSVREFLIDEKF